MKEKEEQIEQLKEKIAILEETVEQQQKIIEKQAELIRELKEQINKDSHNSSKPPSSDGYEKPSPKSLRKKTGKKPGGQKGHQGSHLSVPEKVDEVVQHMPEGCEGCPKYEQCRKEAEVKETRYVIDVVVKVRTVAHETMEVLTCPKHGDTRKGKFPEGIRARVQYGNQLQALATALVTEGAVSVKRTHEILGNVFKIPISTGCIVGIVHRCAQKLTEAVEYINKKVAESRVGHFDETGGRVGGKLWWVHNASTREYTHLSIAPKRGYAGMEAGGVLSRFHGVAVHDCWSPYWKYEGIRHAVCNVHLLRELTGVVENHPKQWWAKCFIRLLMDMKASKEQRQRKGYDNLSAYASRKFDKTYDLIIQMGYNLNPIPKPGKGTKKGRPKRGKILSLIDRLSKYKESICLFTKDFSVPFDNNQAERDLRMIKVKTKVSG